MATKPSEIRHLYEFGPFRLDPQKRILLRGDHAVSLTPKAVETLVVLVENRERVVSKDDLMKMLWPDSFVEESNLSQNIFVLRKALGDSAQERRYILTVPGRGYQFTEAVRDLEESAQTEDTLVLESHSRSRILVEASAPRSGRPTLRAGLAVLTIVLIAFGALVYRARHRPSAEDDGLAPPLPAVKMRRSVAVLGFRNLSGRPDKAWLSTALAEMLNTELAAGEQLRTVPGEQVVRSSRDLPLSETDALAKDSLARLRANLEADYVAIGSYTVLGEGNKSVLRLDFRLQDTAAGETVAEEAVMGNESDLFDLVSEVGVRMRGRLAAGSVSKEQAAQVRSALPSNPKAARLYAEGLAKLEKFDARAARDLLEQAIVADPQHALAHAALAESWSALGYDAKAQKEAKEAFDRSASLSREQRLSIEGRYRELSNDLPAAIEIYRTLRNFFPDDLGYALRLAKAQSGAGLGKDALQTVALMRGLPDPTNKDARIDIAEASAAELLGDFKHSQQAALTADKRADALGNSLLMAAAKSKEAWAAARLGDPERALAAYLKSRELWIKGGNPRSAAAALGGIANLQEDQGDFADARNSFADACGEFRRIGDMGNLGSCSHNLGVLLTHQGDLLEAKKHLEEALSIQRELKNERGVAADLDDIGNVMLSMGDLPAAVRVKEEALETFRRLGNKFGERVTLVNTGELLFSEGKVVAAREKLDQAMAIAKEMGDKKGAGYGLVDIAAVLLAQDRLAEARAAAEQSIAIRQEIKSEVQTAESRLTLAEIALEQGKPEEAESLARSAAEVVDKQKAVADGSLAYSVLARALVAQGKPAQDKSLAQDKSPQDKSREAQAAADRALSLSQQTNDVTIHFEATLARQAVQVESGRLEIAERELKAVRDEAKRRGLAAYELEAGVRLGELELRSGEETVGRGRLQQVQSDARAKGFLLIARKAAAALVVNHRTSEN